MSNTNGRTTEDYMFDRIAILHSYGHETCAECGTQNRYWVSRKGYDSPEYMNWIDTGLCPRCHDPKDSSNQYIIHVCCMCSIVTNLSWANRATNMEAVELSHGYCSECQSNMMKQLGL